MLTRSGRPILAAILLFFVAPLVAEYLLGDLPITLLPALVLLAPMYGGGAVVIRELARRTQRGWPAILILGAAYAILEEGLLTQSLFNPDYLHLHAHLLEPAHMARFGMGGWWTLLMLNVHTFWSIGVSIALVEGAYPSLRTQPWLGNGALATFAIVFLLGSAANAAFGIHQNHFVAKSTQLVAAGLACCALAASAFVLLRRRTEASTVPVPSPWVTGVGALLLGAAIWLIPSRWGWKACAAMLAVDCVFLTSVLLLSSSARWTPVHTVSLGAGGAVCYGLHAFVQPPMVGSGPIIRIGNVIFLAAAIGLIALGARRTGATAAQDAAETLRAGTA